MKCDIVTGGVQRVWEGGDVVCGGGEGAGWWVVVVEGQAIRHPDSFTADCLPYELRPWRLAPGFKAVSYTHLTLPTKVNV